MSTVFPGWLSGNESRKYPLHDLATKQGASGATLPDDILVDMQLLVPESAGRYVFVSSLSATAGLVSLTLLATDLDPTTEGASSSVPFVPLAAITVTRPITLYRNYAVSALYPGVAGWVAFGTGVNEQLNTFFTFEQAIDGLLAPKAARGYQDYPVQSIGKIDRTVTLTGLVALQGSAEIEVEKGVRTIDGRRREVITVGLALGDTPKPVLRKFAGDCGGRPDDRTCPEGRPIRLINGVTPDCDGNIDIVFEGIGMTLVRVINGLIVDSPIGLDDVCTPFDPSRYDPNDLCASSSSSSGPPESSSSSSSPSPEPTPPTPPTPTEYFDNFSDKTLTFDTLSILKGTWDIYDVPLSEAIVGRERLHALDAAAENVIIHPAINRTADGGYWAFSTIRASSEASNGHVIFAYKGDDDFWYAGHSINTDGAPYGRLYVGHKTGDLGSTLDNWPQGLEFGYQFDAAGGPNTSVDPAIFPGTLLGSDIRTEIFVRPIAGSSELHLVQVEWYWNRSGQGYPNPAEPFNTVTFATGFDLSGYLGMGAVACKAHFDEFGIFNVPPESSS